MFDLTKLKSFDITNLEVLLNARRSLGFKKWGMVCLIPGVQQYVVNESFSKLNTLYRHHPKSSTGITSYLIPNLIIDEPFILTENAAKMFLLAAKAKSPTTSVTKEDWGIQVTAGDYGITLYDLSSSSVDEVAAEYNKRVDGIWEEDENGNRIDGTFRPADYSSGNWRWAHYQKVGIQMYEAIQVHKKNTKELDKKILLSFKMSEMDIWFFKKSARLFDTISVRKDTTYLFQIGYKEGIWKKEESQKPYDKDKIYISYVSGDDRTIKYSEGHAAHSSQTSNDVIEDNDDNKEFMFRLPNKEFMSLRKQDYGFQLYEIERTTAGNLGLMCQGLKFGEAYYFICEGINKKFEGDERGKYVNHFRVRTEEQEKEFQKEDEIVTKKRKQASEYLKNFKSVSKLFPKEEGDVDWIPIDNFYYEGGLKCGQVYSVDKTTYENELADTMRRLKLTKEKVFEKQRLLAEHPNFIIEVKKFRNKDKNDDDFVLDYFTKLGLDDETISVKKRLADVKSQEEELKALLEIVEEIKKENKKVKDEEKGYKRRTG